MMILFCAPKGYRNFDQMASSLKTTLDAITVYDLGHTNVEAIESVKIDGVLIAADKYSLRDGKQVVLDRSVIQATSQNIEVFLKVKP